MSDSSEGLKIFIHYNWKNFFSCLWSSILLRHDLRSFNISLSFIPSKKAFYLEAIPRNEFESSQLRKISEGARKIIQEYERRPNDR